MPISKPKPNANLDKHSCRANLQKPALFLALTLSILAHFSIAILISHFSESAPLKTLPQTNPVKIQLSHSKTPKEHAKKATPAKRETAASSETSPKLRKSSFPAAPIANSSLPKSYTELLKLSKHATGNGVSSEPYTPKAYTGNALPELIAHGSDVAANFDIPLTLRKEISQGKAWAHLKLHHQAIEIVYLAGLPELRAALFETLKTPTTLKLLSQLFDYFQADNYRITVDYRIEYGAVSPRPFDTNVKVYDRDIVLITTHYPDAPRYGVTGISIEDEHSRRAKRKDQRHLARLRESPAFKSPLSGFKLPPLNGPKVFSR